MIHVQTGPANTRPFRRTRWYSIIPLTGPFDPGSHSKTYRRPSHRSPIALLYQIPSWPRSERVTAGIWLIPRHSGRWIHGPVKKTMHFVGARSPLDRPGAASGLRKCSCIPIIRSGVSSRIFQLSGYVSTFTVFELTWNSRTRGSRATNYISFSVK